MLRKVQLSPLRRARLLSGYLQKDIARAIGRSGCWLSHVEDGDLPVSERDQRRLAKIFGTSVEALFPKGGCDGKK
jgi:transcriptional regulator with XRE-family HTH domain